MEGVKAGGEPARREAARAKTNRKQRSWWTPLCLPRCKYRPETVVARLLRFLVRALRLGFRVKPGCYTCTWLLTVFYLVSRGQTQCMMSSTRLALRGPGLVRRRPSCSRTRRWRPRANATQFEHHNSLSSEDNSWETDGRRGLRSSTPRER